MSITTARAAFETLRSRSSATVTGSYQLVGSAFTHPIVLIKVVNNSDQLVTVSYDGVEDEDVVPANSFFLYDLNSNKYDPRGNNGMPLPVGNGVYIKGTAGTGTIYVTAIYAG